MPRSGEEFLTAGIVNGKYTTDVAMAGDNNKLVAIINDLAASEKKP